MSGFPVRTDGIPLRTTDAPTRTTSSTSLRASRPLMRLAVMQELSPSPPILTTHGLSKRFGSLWALRDVGFSVRDGEILGLIGPNGSGKTTLFQCVAGMMPMNAGSVWSNGTPLDDEERTRILFYMPDGIRPWPDQTVDWALGFIADLYTADAARRHDIIAALGVDPLLPVRMGALSKGQHKRVLLAAALLTNQPLLLLDEPFDGLDLRQTRDTMDVLRQHARNGRTLFLSIHQLSDAERVCDRFVLLSGGQAAGEGTLEELRTRARAADVNRELTLEEVFLALT